MTENIKEMIAVMGMPDVDPPWEGAPKEMRGEINVLGIPESVQILSIHELRGFRMAQVRSKGFLGGIRLLVPVDSVKEVMVCY